MRLSPIPTWLGRPTHQLRAPFIGIGRVLGHDPAIVRAGQRERLIVLRLFFRTQLGRDAQDVLSEDDDIQVERRSAAAAVSSSPSARSTVSLAIGSCSRISPLKIQTLTPQVP